MENNTATQKVTIKVATSRISLLAPSGAEVAYIPDGTDQLIFDPLADTAEAFGLVPMSYKDFCAKQGLDAFTVLSIVASTKGAR